MIDHDLVRIESFEAYACACGAAIQMHALTETERTYIVGIWRTHHSGDGHEPVPLRRAQSVRADLLRARGNARHWVETSDVRLAACGRDAASSLVASDLALVTCVACRLAWARRKAAEL
jgi:hypothetical protein